MSYRIRRAPTLETLAIRGLRFQLYRWRGESPQPFVFVHGWGDTGETFQFVVDHLAPQHTVVAFDARGFGRSEWPQDGFWFPDYLADLDAVLDSVSPDAPVDLLGHSMGGNVAMLYAGVRPQRVRRLINLEGFGLQPGDAGKAPNRYREWLDEVRRGTSFSTYESFEQFAEVLARRNPHTPAAHLEFISRSWGRRRDDGRVELRCDPRHKRVNPVLYQRDQAEACWREIIAPVLFLIGGRSDVAKRLTDEAVASQFQSQFRSITMQMLADAGHMMHHEQPAQVAELIEQFFR